MEIRIEKLKKENAALKKENETLKARPRRPSVTVTAGGILVPVEEKFKEREAESYQRIRDGYTVKINEVEHMQT